MDKNVALIAEQVGLLLAPTLRGIVGALFSEAVGGLLSKVADVQTLAERLRADMESKGDSMKAVEDDLRKLYAAHVEKLESFEKYVDSTLASKEEVRGATESGDQRATALRKELTSLTELVLTVRTATEQQISAVRDTLRDVQSAHAAKLQEMDAAAKAGADTWRTELDKVRAESLNPIAAKQAELEETALSRSAAHARDIEALQAASASLHEKLVAYSGAADRLNELEAQLSGSLQSGLALAEEHASKLQCSLDSLAASVARLRDAEPKTVTIKAEPDLALIAAAVAEAVKSIRVPAPDMDALAVEARSAATEAAADMLPTLRDALSRNIHDEISRTIAALPPAKNGEPGPPGLMGTVEPYIEGVVYERLALVSHAGGAWQATRRTKTAPAGASPDWQAIAAGVSSVAVRATDTLRNVEIVTVLSDGTEVKSVVAVPAMVYRDVYDPAKAYEYADITTYAGSLWLALKTTTGEQPSKSPDAWRLIVKRGQEGKDGRDGKDGVQFQAGFEGEFEENRSYPRNAIVTYAGSIWISKRPTKERPPYMTNADSEHWLRLR